MKMTAIRATMLAATCLTFASPALASAPSAADAAAAGGDSAAGDGDQTTTANAKGQANDAQALTSSDIIVTGSRTAEIAPLTASLTTTQPQTAVNRAYIDSANPGSDMFQLVSLAPSVNATGNTNGTGLGETKVSIRGFQDGEYNVTYDSIPFADTNNPTHHSTAFFPSNTIETVVVDRGPGNASQLGQATYGGNLNLYSRAAKETMGGQIEGVYGTWNTVIVRAELQSGAVQSLGGARFVLAGQYLQSDGAATFSPVGSKNLFFKMVLPIGSANTLTVMSTWNRNFYYQSDVLKGATCGTGGAALPAGTQLNVDSCTPTSNIGVYGLGYALGNDPTKQDFWQYNRTDKTTDFSYLRLQSNLGSGFSMDNRVYMYAYTNNTLSGNAGRTVTGFSGLGTPASPYVAIQGPATDVLGYDKMNKYRVYGYIGQINYDFPLGKIRVGGWFEHANTWRHLYDFDWTTGQSPAYIEKFNNGNGTAAQNVLPPIGVANIRYEQNSGWNQYQLFAEFEIHPMDGLAITPGVKYLHFTRSINALVNQTSRLPLGTQATWTKTLPFLTVNWQVKPNWAFYGQYAQGMYVPDLSSFYSASGSLSTALDALQPQTTTNYQIGTVWHGEKVSIDLDAYKIDVNNKIGTCTTTGCDTSLLVNIGTVHYKGVEGQISLMPTKHFSLFGNASWNYAHSASTGVQISKAPYYTATLGLVYNGGGFKVSFAQKFTGPAYANEYSGSGPRNYRIEAYSLGELSVSKEFGDNLQIGLNLSNVFNTRPIYGISTGKIYGVDDQFNIVAPRQILANLRVKF